MADRNVLFSCTSAKDIVDRLRLDYFQPGSAFSSATSSHWIKYGESQVVEKTTDGYRLAGVGFGDYRERNLRSILSGLPSQIYLLGMLHGCDKLTVKAAKHIATVTNRYFSYDVARMVRTVDFLMKYANDVVGKRIVIIGDGYGTLGCLLKARFPSARITQINLGRTLTFDVYYSGCIFPTLSHKLISSAADELCEDFNYVEAEKVGECAIEGDLFINIASMQEMNPTSIGTYFAILRNQRSNCLFYCCNRLEKRLPDGTTTRFFDYGWSTKDEMLVDELCPWHQRMPKNRPPFVQRFDGPHQHRLVRIQSAR